LVKREENMADLNNQINNMHLGADGTSGTAHRKRRDRHAYHQIEQSAAAQPAFNGTPAGPPGIQGQYQNAPLPGTASPYMSQQMPAPNGQGGQYAPEHNSRNLNQMSNQNPAWLLEE